MATGLFLGWWHRRK
ncbi:hypothetical protein NPN19_25405 [Vibrio parahaemolyticus]|nr:hypothetical protein [Vibrio parahaemolyticus]